MKKDFAAFLDALFYGNRGVPFDPDGLKLALSTLTPKQEFVLRLRFGLECKAAKSLADIAGSLAISRGRVGQIEEQGLRQLRSSDRRKLYDLRLPTGHR